MAILSVAGRPWCDVCKKFTKANGDHDCDPNWRSRLQAGRKASSGKKRRWRLTPKRQEKLKKLCKFAALGKVMKSNKAAQKVSSERLTKISHQLYRSLGFK